MTDSGDASLVGDGEVRIDVDFGVECPEVLLNLEEIAIYEAVALSGGTELREWSPLCVNCCTGADHIRQQAEIRHAEIWDPWR